MTASIPTVWPSSFHPDADPDTATRMTEAFLQQRARLAWSAVADAHRINVAAGSTPVDDRALDVLSAEPSLATEVFDDPVFAIWMRYFHRARVLGSSVQALAHAAALPELLARVCRRLAGGADHHVPATRIPVLGFDLDPYAMVVTPPSYDFQAAAQRRYEAPPGHPISLQADLLGVALERIADSWPELRGLIIEHVKIIGYLPDADFRSCSAARYAGIVFFGNTDASLLDIEESLVHEAGHQVLYRLAELTPLTQPDLPREASYELPWSGSRRDLFGYLHAYYIYVLLSKYFWRRAALGDHSAHESRERSRLIQLGSRLAGPVLLADPGLTPQGRTLVRELAADVDALHLQIEAAQASEGT